MGEKITVERQEHSHYFYIRGEKPKFKVGDNLAFYEFYHDYEGEELLGKVKSVELDKEEDDWTYEFENGYWCTERSLIDDEAYIKRENK